MANRTYEDTFEIIDECGDSFVCSSTVSRNETTVLKAFLRIYYLHFGDMFTARVDTGGGILLETISIYDDGDDLGIV